MNILHYDLFKTNILKAVINIFEYLMDKNSYSKNMSQF